MGRRVEVPITPSVLEWAIEESGYSLPEVSSVVKGGEPVLASWLDGTAKPSLTEVKDVAKKLHRQVATFLLPKPPKVAAPIVKFRHPLGNKPRPLNPDERRYLRRARRLQEAYAWLASELRRNVVDFPEFAFSDSPVAAAADIRKRLQITLTQQRNWKSPANAFDAWREALERLGVLVFLFPLGETSVRGFSLWNDRAPLAAINTTWRDEARIFSLFHELGHLLTRSSSACAAITLATGDAKDRAERWCERFAAAALVPANALDEVGRVSALGDLSALARRYKVSLTAMALQLIHLDKAAWSLMRVIPKSADAKKSGGGGAGRNRREAREDQIGRRGAQIFVDAVVGDVIGPSEALDYLDIPRDDFESLVMESSSRR